ATYAAIPHLVDVAKQLPPGKREKILYFVGYSVAFAALPDAPAIPDFLHEAYREAIRQSTALLAETLLESFPEEVYRHLLAAMAALKGFTELCFVITGLTDELRCRNCGQGN